MVFDWLIEKTQKEPSANPIALLYSLHFGHVHSKTLPPTVSGSYSRLTKEEETDVLQQFTLHNMQASSTKELSHQNRIVLDVQIGEYFVELTGYHYPQELDEENLRHLFNQTIQYVIRERLDDQLS